MSTFWDEKFGSDEFLYGKEPNRYIEEKSSLLTPLSVVVCLGEGEGRNGVYLAKKGHNVVAIDNSSVGLTKAHKFANEEGVEIASLLIDLGEWEPKKRVCDAVVTSYCHLGEPLREAVWNQVFATLKNKGYFVAEFFSKDQLSYTSGGPKDVNLLYDAGEVEQLLQKIGFTLIELEKCETLLAEGRGHQGVASVVRFVAQKP